MAIPLADQTTEATHSAAVISGWRLILTVNDMLIALLKDHGVKIYDKVSFLLQ